MIHSDGHTYTVIKWIFVVLVFALILWCVKLVAMDAPEIEANIYNPITAETKASVIRGSITDIHGNLLAYTDSEEGGTGLRLYPYGESCAHVVGYKGRGDAGMEAYLDKTLSESALLDQLTGWANDEKVKGNNVRLTLDADLQRYIYNLFDGYHGAVIITDCSTGAVKALVSSPSYDPLTLLDNWETVAERDDSPLYQRATQGLYPPGSTFKIVTALSMYRNMEDWKGYTYTCNGSLHVDDQSISCAAGNVHGELTINKAFAQSCNGFFGSAGVTVGKRELESTFSYLRLYESFGFCLPQSQSAMNMPSYESDAMIAQDSIGQGTVAVTPFAMNMLTCAIANEGALYKPYLQDAVFSASGMLLSQTTPSLWGSMMSVNEAAFLKELMRGVVTDGTGSSLNSDAYTAYGKTGTAQVEGNRDHSWFTGFVVLPSGETIAITVLIENGGSDKRAVPMVRQILEHMIQ